jgi:ferredoxin
VSSTLRVDPIACEAHGFCAELLAERISLDDWGYPIIDPRPIDSTLEPYARRAVQACPTLALSLVRVERAGAHEGAPRRRAR